MPINNAYIQDPGRCGTPLYMPGEEYAFYINFDTPIGDPDFFDFRLGLYNDEGMIISNVGTLERQFLNSSPLYNIYCNFVFPNVEPGFYWFGIYVNNSELLKCKSNVIAANMVEYLSSSNYYQYRHSQNIYGFFYYPLTDFINKVRLLSNQINEQWETDQQQYRNVTDGKFRNVKNYRDRLVTVETYYFDSKGHEGFTAMLDHDYLVINESKYTRKTSYVILNKTQSEIAKGTVELYEIEEGVYDMEFNTVLHFDVFATDNAYNVTATFESLGNTTFSFNRLVSFVGLPTTMELKLNGHSFMIVDFLSDYLGQPFKISDYEGLELRGIFTNGEVNFIE